MTAGTHALDESKYSTTRRTDQMDHDLDPIDPNLPLCDAVQDLYSTDPTQEPCPRSCRLYTAPTLQHELDITAQGSICPVRSRSFVRKSVSVRCVKYTYCVPAIFRAIRKHEAPCSA